MCNIFKGVTYVIGVIRKREVKEVLKIAKDLGLGIMYPDIFKNVESDLYKIAISDDRLGGHVSAIICWQELTVLKSKDWGYFHGVKELKTYIAKAKKENG